MNERETILRLKRGDLGGLALLVERYQVQAVRTAYLITHDRATAEDVVQAMFVGLPKKIMTFDITRDFAPWFMRGVVNAAIQAAQRQSRHISLDEREPGAAALADWLPSTMLGPDDQLETHEIQQMVWAALQKLAPEQRAAVVMRYYLDLSEDEMSAAMDCPPGTVKWRLHTARNQLRVLLRNIFHPAGEW